MRADNNVDDAGATALAGVLQDMSRLTMLDLSRTHRRRKGERETLGSRIVRGRHASR